jgi:hypothetical protein
MDSPQEQRVGADHPDQQMVMPSAFFASQPWPKPMLQKAGKGARRAKLNGDGDAAALCACTSRWGSRGGAAA